MADVQQYSSEKNNLWTKINVKYKYIFLCSFVVGVIAHGMALFNKYMFHDEAAYYLFNGGMSDWWLNGGTYKAGRWMLGIIGQVTGLITGDNISSSTFAGVVSIVFLALSGCLIVAILDIKSRIISVLIGMLMVVCPIIVGLFGFMYIAPHYLFGLFLGFLGTYFICKKNSRLRWSFGILLMGASVGVYQAFIPCMLSMCLYCFIRDDCIKNQDIKSMMAEMVYYIFSAVAFMLVYLLGNKIFLTILQFELIDYKGINSMLNIMDMGNRFINVFRYFIIPDNKVAGVIFPHTTLWIYYICMIVWVVSSIFFIVDSKHKKGAVAKSIISIVAFSCVPFTVSFIYMMCDKQYVAGHMAYGQTMFFVYLLFVADNLNYRYGEDKLKKGGAGLITALMGLTCILYMRFDNISYVKAEIAQQRVISWSNTLAAKIRCTEGYNDDFPVIYLGANKKNDKALKDLDDFTFIIDAPYYDVETLINDYAFERFMSIWTGFTPEVSFDADSVINDEQYKFMPCYPDDGSIAIINEKVVVKFAE